ncbi:hypothetical protein L0156_19820 [bacterium]|nr:hypothetical protein [bacterium]
MNDEAKLVYDPQDLERLLVSREFEEIVKILELEEIPYLLQLGTALHFRIAGNPEWQAVLHLGTRTCGSGPANY